jgi:HEAT repeat protein
MSTITEIPFQQLLDALLDEATPLQPRYLYRLSDLEPPELALLEGNWTRVPVWRRQSLLEDLEQLGEADPLLSFEAVGRMALHDADPIVRSRATHLLWEIETHDLIPVFLQMLASDPDVQARASAANLLGRFVYRGEVDQLPEQLLQDLQDQLLQAASSQASSLVRRRALESISYSSRHEVQPLIESAYASGDKDWMATALLAMGRSADDRWAETVLAALDHKYPILRAEAARAAGELEIPTAVSRLIELIEDSDDDVRQAAIWSLSQIGGEGVREALEKIWEQSEDEDEIDLLENALDNLAFTEGMPPFNLFVRVPELVR